MTARSYRFRCGPCVAWAAPVGLAIAVSCHDGDGASAPLTPAPTPSLITTIAGSRLAFSGDNGPAAQATINGPAAVAVGGRGVLYISDELNQRIRKVDTDGTITTLAGTGSAGSSGDGGAASAASLNNAIGIAVDTAAGTVFVADAGNNRIRAINSAGIMVAVAGDGTAGFSGDGARGSSARLSAPSGVAVDVAAGALYIADTGNNRIRKFASDGTITTVAGSGATGASGDGGQATLAQLSGPVGIAVDATGNLYIADEGNSRIRKVDRSGVITTIAGTGAAGAAGDGGQATQATLNHPRGVAVDGAGNVYVGDTRNIRVRRVSRDGIIANFAGTGQRGFAGDGGTATQAQLRAPHGMAVDQLGNVFVADYGNNEVRRVDVHGIITTFAGSGAADNSSGAGDATAIELAHPRSVAADAAGNFYISDWNNNCVWKVTRQGKISTLAGNRTPGFSGDGGPGADAQLTAPHGIAVDAAGNVYIADQNNSRVRRVGLDGIIRTIAGDGRTGAVSGDGGPATAAVVAAPSALALDAAGNLYISQQTQQVIRRVSPDGIITTIAGNGTAGYSGDGGPALQGTMRTPVGIASDSAGNVFIAEQGNNVIRKVSVAGIITTVAGNGTQGFSGDGGPATAASIDGPFGVAVDRTGNVYLTDSRNNRIRWVHRDGTITTVAGDGSPGFSGDGGPPTEARLQGPHGVVVDAAGNILIADTANDRIRRVSVAQPSTNASPIRLP